MGKTLEDRKLALKASLAEKRAHTSRNFDERVRNAPEMPTVAAKPSFEQLMANIRSQMRVNFNDVVYSPTEGAKQPHGLPAHLLSKEPSLT